MSQFVRTRGRKKAVSRFTVAKGLWMIAILSVVCVFVLFLFLLSYLRVD